MSVGFTSSPAAEQEALKKIYAQKGGNCPGVCAEGHRIRGRNVVRHANRDYCRKCVESGFGLFVVLGRFRQIPKTFRGHRARNHKF